MGQFAIPLAVLGIGLIGEWLLGPKKSSTSKPDSMPSLNSAIRGTTVPITFGSNRVSAQVTWTNKFKATRQKGSGKGASKGGGSGGFGAAKGGGSAAAGYEYFWDMKFDFGIMDTPAMIRRGWIGSDTIDKDAISNLTAGGSDLVQGLFPVTSVVSANVAKLNYTEAFVGQAFPTDSGSLTSWPYFNTQANVECAWPYNAWVGFEQLDLGQSPSVPQLSFEWVPKQANGFVPQPTQFSDITIADVSGDAGFARPQTNATFMQDDDGKHWVYITGNAIGRVIYCPDTGDSFTMPNSRFVADGGSVIGGNAGLIPVPGTPYFIMWGGSTGSTYYNQIMLVYKLQDGDATVVASVSGATSGLGYGLPGDVAGAFYDKSSGSLYVCGDYNGNLGESRFAVGVYPLTEWIGLGTITGVDFTTFYTEIFDDSTTGSGNSTWGYLGTYSGSGRHFFTVPIGSTDVYVYFSKENVDYMASHSGLNTIWDDVAALGSGGHFVKISRSGDLDHPTVISLDDKFDLSDAGLNKAGTTGGAADDYSTPNAQIGPDGNIILAMARNYSDDPGFVRAQIYDFDADKVLADFKQSLFDPTALSVYDGAGGDYVQLGFDPATLQINYMWSSGGVLSNSALVFGGAFTTSFADVTPAYIVYRVLTDQAFGFATQSLFGFTVTADRIDTSSYNKAVSECQSQGCYISVTYKNSGNLLTILNDLLALYGGYLTENDGIISFGFVGTGSNEGPAIRTLDNHHFVVDESNKGKPVQVTKGALEDGYNKVVFNYVDRATDYGTNQVIVSDEVDMDINGPRIKTWDTQYVMTGSLATQCAVRALWANLYGKDSYSFQLGWKDRDLRPGDVVTLVDSFDNTLNAGVRARLTKRTMTDKRGVYAWQAIREYSSIVNASAVYTQTSSIDPGFGGLVEPIAPLIDFRAYELPQEYQGAKAYVYFGYNQASAIAGAKLYLSTDGGASFVEAGDSQPFVVGGMFAQPLQDRPKGYVEDLVEFWLLPSSSLSVSTPTFAQEYELDDITPAVRAAGGGIMIVGSEAVAFETLTLLGQNHYRARRVYRGWGGTPITSHNSGALFHQHAAGIFAFEITQDKIGTIWQYKIAPYNFAGTMQDISSIDPKTYTIRGEYWLPRIQPQTQIKIASAMNWNAATPVNGQFWTVTSGGCDINLSWTDASQTEGYGAGGYGAGGFGHSQVDSVNWRIDIASKNGAKVSSFVVNSNAFSYTRAQNSADFGGFGRDLIFTVTPFNIKGDGPVADTRSLSLLW